MGCRKEEEWAGVDGCSGGEVGILHGVEVVDGVPHTPLQGPGLRGCQERVTQVTEGHVIAVQVMEEGVRTWSKTGPVLRFAGVGGGSTVLDTQ